MSVTPTRRLTAEQIAALRFAAQRQLARWSDKTGLSPHQQAQRAELRRAADILNDDALVRGCELHACADAEDVDA
jgi:transcriptional regulator GlxA family with amidase domain